MQFMGNLLAVGGEIAWIHVEKFFRSNLTLDKDVSSVGIVGILEVEKQTAGFVTVGFSSLKLAVEFFLNA